MSMTRIRGLSDAYGSWKIICSFSCCFRASDDASMPSGAPRQYAAVRQGQQSGREPAERRLAASRLADETDDLAGKHGDIDVVDGTDDFLADVGAEPVADLRGEVERLDESFRRAAQLDQRIAASLIARPPLSRLRPLPADGGSESSAAHYVN